MPKESGKSVPAAIVLLSAGLDSTYNLLKAHQTFLVSLVLTIDYGQKAAPREIEASRRLAAHFQLPHKVLTLPWFSEFTSTSLVGSEDVPSGQQIQIDSLERSKQTAKSVWVPNRNGIFLNIAAGFAEGLGAEFVIPGFNLEEAETFPDNSAEFLKALDQSWSFSTASNVRSYCFSSSMSKTQIVADGIKLGLPFAKVWPCYLSGKTWCGRCESCLRFRRAIEANGLSFEKLNEGHQ